MAHTCKNEGRFGRLAPEGECPGCDEKRAMQAAQEEQAKKLTDAEMDAQTKDFGKKLSQEKKVSVYIPIDKLNPHDNVVPVTINGYSYVIKRGEDVEVPEIVRNILREASYV